LRLLIFLLLAYLVYRLIRGILREKLPKERPPDTDRGHVDEMVQDPQCGTYIPLSDAHRRVIDGREHFFCSSECAEAFENKERPEN